MKEYSVKCEGRLTRLPLIDMGVKFEVSEARQAGRGRRLE